MSSPFGPAVTSTTNPVAQQVVTAGNQLHNEALRGAIDPAVLKAAVEDAVRDQFVVTDAWKPKPRIQFVIECPSGQRCLAKYLNTMDLVDADLIEEVDFFTKRLFPSSFDAAGNPVDQEEEESNDKFWSTLKDNEKKVRFFRLLNKILSVAVVKPKVIDDGVDLQDDEYGNKTVVYGSKARPLRDGEVYASAIDFADKMTIFGELNKPLEQIKPFREESATELPDLPAVEGFAGKA